MAEFNIMVFSDAVLKQQARDLCWSQAYENEII